MKRQIIVLLGVTVLSVGMLAGCGVNTKAQKESGAVETSHENVTVQNTTANDTTTPGGAANETSSSKKTAAVISEEEAKNIAFKDANVKEADVANLHIKREMEEGIEVYDVDFYIGTNEYDYTISAENGNILEKDIDVEDNF